MTNSAYPPVLPGMRLRPALLCLLLLCAATAALAQQPFAEGTITYRVKLEPAGQKACSGTYTFTFKGRQLRKELKLANGYQDAVVYDCAANTVYSLQTRGGKKYAIQLDMADMLNDQAPYTGYTLKKDGQTKKIAGCNGLKGAVAYRDGTSTPIYYCPDWYAAEPITYERFPGAKFLPLYFTYKDRQGTDMEFEAQKAEPHMVENAMFAIPPDYKLISNKEYKELSR